MIHFASPNFPIFTWPFALPFWIILAWAFYPERRLNLRARKSASSPDSKDAGSFRFAHYAVQTALILALVLPLLSKKIAAASFPGWMAWLGILLLAFGSALRRYCFRVLGPYFTGDVQVAANQRVIESGPYRWIRHPSYTGALMVFAGVGLSLGNWCSFLVLVIIPSAAYGYRIFVEERVLSEALGDSYASYMGRTKRLIPFVL